MDERIEVERVVRTRLRNLRQTVGLSLAGRTLLNASTISRSETGKRSISLDVSVPLARPLQVDLDPLLDVHVDDVVTRPTPSCSGDRTTWVRNRPTRSTVAVKMRLEHREVGRLGPEDGDGGRGDPGVDRSDAAVEDHGEQRAADRDQAPHRPDPPPSVAPGPAASRPRARVESVGGRIVTADARGHRDRRGVGPARTLVR